MRERLRVIFGPSSNEADRIHLADILRNETMGGAIMLVATVAALLWANLWPHNYESVVHHHFGLMSVGHWASDGLLTLFFFVAGLELKREFVEGSLSRPADALVPIIAAVCGMAVPAALYVGVQLASDAGKFHGWAIPMATDIAFALAVLAIVGRHLPSALRAFLLTLAIVDDLGAILVIAIFYSTGLDGKWLAGTAVCALLWWLGHKRRISFLPGYVFLFVAAWWCMYSSGIHATIAGVLLGLLTAISPDEMDDPADKAQQGVQPWSAGVAVPLFALFSAGVHINGETFVALWRDPVPLGIILGLVVGKVVGIFGGAWLAAHFTAAELGEGVRWRDVLAVAQLAGMGFTVSLLISELAFAGDALHTEEAKAGVLIASTLAAVLGGIALAHRSRRHRDGLTPATVESS